MISSPRRKPRRAAGSAGNLVLPLAIVLSSGNSRPRRWLAVRRRIADAGPGLEAWRVWAFGPAGLGLNPYSGTWLANVLFSAERVGKGFLCAILVGVPVGIAIGWNCISAGALDPTIQLLRPIPITAWLPFSIAVFGFGILARSF